MMTTQVPPRSRSKTKYSTPTEYNGQRFRSKLEADWARAFDALGIRWEYEDVGRYFGDQFYLVDFFLPQSRQFVEVKGVFEPNDCRKIYSLLQHVAPRAHTNLDGCPDVALIACTGDGGFLGWIRAPEPRNIEPGQMMRLLTEDVRELELAQCMVCRGWWFMDAEWSWRCQCCGAYDGNALVGTRLVSPLQSAYDEVTDKMVFPDMEWLRAIGGGEDTL